MTDISHLDFSHLETVVTISTSETTESAPIILTAFPKYTDSARIPNVTSLAAWKLARI